MRKSEKHLKLGIKQTIQRHWMDYVVQMLLAGMLEKDIRIELDKYLSTQKQSGGIGVRGSKTYGISIGILASWFDPAPELVELRNDALQIARMIPSEHWLPLHWAIMSSSYPFWFNVAKQVGRLLKLQERITQSQIFNRIKEQYGDRETVERNARYTVRSFVAWGVLNDSDIKGCYKGSPPYTLSDIKTILLMIEAGLHASPEGKSNLNVLVNNPAFFPFTFPAVSGNTISMHNNRIESLRYSLDDEYVQLRQV